jgi:predicted Zn-dependent peptidase
VTAGDVQFEKEYMRRIALLQNEDIQKVLTKYFRGHQLSISILAPDEKTEFFKNLSLKSMVEKGRLDGALVEKKSPILKTVLDNGIRLIVKENPSLPIVTLQVSFLGGVRFEEEPQNGIHHFMAVMVTKGTRNQSNLEIAKKVERMVGSLNGKPAF